MQPPQMQPSLQQPPQLQPPQLQPPQMPPQLQSDSVFLQQLLQMQMQQPQSQPPSWPPMQPPASMPGEQMPAPPPQPALDQAAAPSVLCPNTCHQAGVCRCGELKPGDRWADIKIGDSPPPASACNEQNISNGTATGTCIR